MTKNMQKSMLTGKPVIHFAHANGMPSKVYQPLFEQLQPYFSIEYIELFGATDGYVIDDHWCNLTQQIIDSVGKACHKHNVTQVLALGHSLGALCTMQAIYRRPELFAQAVLLDPPWIYGVSNLVWHIGKQLDKLPKMNHFFLDKLSPSGLSKHRRDLWDSREQAKASFARSKFFANFDPRCLDGYVEHGLKETADGKVTLAIPKINEVSVFRTNPSWYWLTPNAPPKLPVTLVIGTESKFMEHKFPHKIRSRLKIPFVNHQGGHMFPLEHPKSVAKLVLELYTKQA